MARESLQTEIQKLIGTTKKKQSAARKKLARLYCNEVVLHTTDLTDAIFEHYKKQSGFPNLTSNSPLFPIFKQGAKVFVRTARETLRGRRKVQAWKNVHVSTFKGGLVIYLTGHKLTFESSAWRNILTKDVDGARDTMERFVNKKLRKAFGKNGFPELNAKGFATGHHGGTLGSDPKTTYATGAITNEAQIRTSKVDKDLATVELDAFDPSIVASYSDIFWWNMMDVINENYSLLWGVTQNTQRPNRAVTVPAELDDEYMYRIVYGKTSANIMNPYDRSGQAKLRVGLEMKKLITQARQETERQVKAYIKANIGMYPDLKGSPSPRNRTRKLAAETIVNALGNEVSKSKGAKKVTTTSEKAKGGTRKRTIKGRTGKKKVERKATKGSRNAKLKGGAVARAGSAAATRSQQRQVTSPVGLTALLNKTLGAQVKKNMGPYPRRLENRTGRFASSAEVTNVAILPKSVEIQYSYQKDPYQVFEPEFGNELASFGRDPKRIIGSTIREIAQSIMGSKFGLVRTKRV
tara:strand:- start:750 stop:2315 length:1566 start_codon:yes stop_codon:yes gene_type:complete